MAQPLFALIQDGSRWELLDWLWAPGAVIIPTYILLSYLFPHRVLRPFWWVVTRVFYNLKVTGTDHIPAGPAVLISNHISRIDWAFLIAAAYPRRVRILAHAGYWRNPVLRFFLVWVRAIPIESRRPTLDKIDDSFERARKALEAGDLVLMFPEGRLSRNGYVRPFHRGLEWLQKKYPVPMVPVAMMNLWGSIFSYRGGRVLWKWPEQWRRKVGVVFGPPMPPQTPAVQMRFAVQRTAAWGHRAGNHWSVPVHRKFVRMAAHRPFRPCLIDAMTKRELNYGKALAGAVVLRNWLKPRTGPEPMIGLWLPSTLGGVLANVAVALLGKTAVNLNYTSSPDSILSAVRQTGLRQVLTARAFIKKAPLDIPAHEGPPDGEKVQIIYLEDALGQIKNWQRVLTFLGIVLLPGWAVERLWLRLGGHQLDDLATVIFSSGSTGEPKGVMLSHRNVAANIESILTATDLFHSDRLLGCLPFFHSFGYTVTLWGPLQIGASGVYYPDPRQAKEIGDTCRNYRATVFLSTATFLRFYLKRSGKDDFKTVRFLICGAEKLPVPLAREFEAAFGVLPLEGYGCTELSPVVSSNIPDREINGVKQVGNKMGTIGQPIPMVAAKVVDPGSYEELPLGQDGLVMVTGANVMVGYLGKPELTAKVIRDGWYETGDVGHMDEDSFVTLTGRLSRIAKVGGEMVPLEKVEEELHAALGTTDRFVAVTSVPDEAKGERLVVLHVELPGTSIRELTQKLAERNLPNLWLPKERDFFQVAELPVLGSGKLDLRRVKEVALEKAGKK